MQLVALHYFELPGAGPGNSSRSFLSLVASIGEDALDKGKETTGVPVENEGCAVTILHIGRMDDNIQQEAKRVDEKMPLAALNLLTRIKALRVKRGAPF